MTTPVRKYEGWLALCVLGIAGTFLVCNAQAENRGGAARGARAGMGHAMPSRSMAREDVRSRGNTTITRTDSGITRSTVVTNGQGDVMTSTTSVMRDRIAGTRSVVTSRTGFDGQTRSSSTSVQRTQDTLNRTRSVTAADGSVRNQTLMVDRDGERGADVVRDKTATAAVRQKLDSGQRLK